MNAFIFSHTQALKMIVTVGVHRILESIVHVIKAQFANKIKNHVCFPTFKKVQECKLPQSCHLLHEGGKKIEEI